MRRRFLSPYRQIEMWSQCVCFPTFTEDLHRLADWLRTCRVDTVAMESTGVYWIPLFQILESRGFEVCLVNARYFQNVPGRKTDVSDCQLVALLARSRTSARFLSGVGARQKLPCSA